MTMTDEQTIRDHKNAGLELHYMDSKELGKLIQEQMTFCKDVVSKLYQDA